MPPASWTVAPPGSATSAPSASHGTKLFSISGDCTRPGIYELPYGVQLRELLALAGGS